MVCLFVLFCFVFFSKGGKCSNSILEAFLYWFVELWSSRTDLISLHVRLTRKYKSIKCIPPPNIPSGDPYLYNTRNQQIFLHSFPISPFKLGSKSCSSPLDRCSFIWVWVTSSSSICQCGRIRFMSAGFTALFPQLFSCMYEQSCISHTRTHTRRLPFAEATAARIYCTQIQIGG